MVMVNKLGLVICGHESEGECRFRHDGGCSALIDTTFKDGWCHFRKSLPTDESDYGVNEYDAIMTRFAKLIGMTLRDAIEAMKDEPGYAYIGSQTAFLVIEEAKNAIVHVSIASAKLADDAKRTEEKAKAKLDQLVKTASKIKDTDAAADWHRANNLQERLEQTNVMYNARLYLAKHVPLLDRKVIDAYPRITGGYAIIIEGEELGKYWSREEYEADLKETKNPG